MTFAKGVTSGYLPLGGVLVSPEVAAPWWTTPGERTLRHGPTYSGHPTCCAAGLATLDVYEREGLIPQGQELEAALEAALAPLREHPYVAEVRAGFGLLAAVELDPGRPLLGAATRRTRCCAGPARPGCSSAGSARAWPCRRR